MKYDQSTTIKLISDYLAGIPVEDIAAELTLNCKDAKIAEDELNATIAAAKLGITEAEYCEQQGILYGLGSEVVPVRSVIAKLSSLGVYKKKEYLTKRGEVPIKKSEYIERIALLLEVSSEILESLEKVNKGVLALLAAKLVTEPKQLELI